MNLSQRKLLQKPKRLTRWSPQRPLIKTKPTHYPQPNQPKSPNLFLICQRSRQQVQDVNLKDRHDLRPDSFTKSTMCAWRHNKRRKHHHSRMRTIPFLLIAHHLSAKNAKIFEKLPNYKLAYHRNNFSLQQWTRCSSKSRNFRKVSHKKFDQISTVTS